MTSPAVQSATADTPIMRLFREREALRHAANEHVPISTGKAADDEFKPLFWKHRDGLDEQLMALPCTCAADFAAKVIVDTTCGGLFSPWDTGEIWVEARALTGGRL